MMVRLQTHLCGFFVSPRRVVALLVAVTLLACAMGVVMSMPEPPHDTPVHSWDMSGANNTRGTSLTSVVLVALAFFAAIISFPRVSSDELMRSAVLWIEPPQGMAAQRAAIAPLRI